MNTRVQSKVFRSLWLASLLLMALALPAMAAKGTFQLPPAPPFTVTSPAVDGDIFYFAYDRNVMAAQKDTVGTDAKPLVWDYPFRTAASLSLPPAVGTSHVYVVDDNGTLYALTKTHGILAWSTALNPPYATHATKFLTRPVLNPSKTKVYVAADDGRLYAYATNATTPQDMTWFSIAPGNGTILGAPTFAQSNAYLVQGGTLYAIDESTGGLAANFTPHGNGTLTSPPAAQNQTVYVGQGSTLVALDALTGLPLAGQSWTVPAGTIVARPATLDNSNKALFASGQWLYMAQKSGVPDTNGTLLSIAVTLPSTVTEDLASNSDTLAFVRSGTTVFGVNDGGEAVGSATGLAGLPVVDGYTNSAMVYLGATNSTVSAWSVVNKAFSPRLSYQHKLGFRSSPAFNNNVFFKKTPNIVTSNYNYDHSHAHPGLFLTSEAGDLVALRVSPSSTDIQFISEWAFIDRTSPINSTPTLYYDSYSKISSIYYGDDNGKVAAVNSTGSKTFETTSLRGAVRSSPAVDKNFLYFGSDDGQFYVMRRDTGATVGTALSTPSATQPIRSAPALAQTQYGNYVVFGTMGGSIYMHRVETNGVLTKRFETHLSGTAISASPAIGWVGTVNGQAYNTYWAYVLTESGDLYAYDIEALTGSLPRFHYAAGEKTRTSPILANGKIYFGDEQGRVHVVSALTGAGKVVSLPNVPTTVPLRGALTAGNDDSLFVATSDGKAYALQMAPTVDSQSSVATVLWSYDPQAGSSIAPTLLTSSAQAYMATLNGTLLALDPGLTSGPIGSWPMFQANTHHDGRARGKPLTSLWESGNLGDGAVVNNVTAPIIGADGTIYSGSSPLVALNPATGMHAWKTSGGLSGDGFYTYESTLNPPLMAADGSLYVVAGNYVFHLSPYNQLLHENIYIPSSPSSPLTLVNSLLMMGVYDNNYYMTAVDISKPTASLAWSYLPANLEQGNVKGAIVTGRNGNIYFFNAHLGKLVMVSSKTAVDNTSYKHALTVSTYSTGVQLLEDSSVAVGTDGSVYFPAGPNMTCLSPNLTTKRWGFTLPDGAKFANGSPVLGPNGRLYAGDKTGRLFEINPGQLDAQGQPTYRVYTPQLANMITYGTPVLGADGVVYYLTLCTSDSKLYVHAVDLTGERMVAQQSPVGFSGAFNGSPLLARDGTLLIPLGGAGKLLALSTSSPGPAHSPWPMWQKDVTHSGVSGAGACLVPIFRLLLN